MDDIFAAAIVHEICPICGKSMNEQIVINKRLTKQYADKVRNMNNKAIGISKNACDNCTKHKDEVIYCIIIDLDKSDNNNTYRTGQIFGLRKNYALFVDHPEFIIITDNGVSYRYIDEKFAKQIKLIKE